MSLKIYKEKIILSSIRQEREWELWVPSGLLIHNTFTQQMSEYWEVGGWGGGGREFL